MRVLSFDVGITNLSWCLMEIIDDQFDILDWALLDVKSGHVQREFLDCDQCPKPRVLVMDENGQKISSQQKCIVHSQFKTTGKMTENGCQLLARKGPGAKADRQVYTGIIGGIMPVNLPKFADNSVGKMRRLCSLLTKVGPVLDQERVDYVVVEDQQKFAKCTTLLGDALLTYYAIAAENGKREVEIICLRAHKKDHVYDGPQIKSQIKDKRKRRKWILEQKAEFILSGQSKKWQPSRKSTQWKVNFWDKFAACGGKMSRRHDLADAFLQALAVCSSQ